MVATATPRGRLGVITKWGVARLNVRHTEEGVLQEGEGTGRDSLFALLIIR